MQQLFLDMYITRCREPDVLFDCPAVQDDVASKSWVSSSEIKRTCNWKGLICFKRNVSLDFLCKPLNPCQLVQVGAGAGFDYWHPKTRSFGTRLSDGLSQHALLRSPLNRRRHEATKGEGKGQWANVHDFLSWWDHSCGDNILHDHEEACVYPASPPLTYHQLKIQVESLSRGPTIYQKQLPGTHSCSRNFRKSSWTKQFSSACIFSPKLWSIELL